jgi:hypothetical protein
MPKSKHQIPGRVRSAYEFIKAHRDQYSVQMMCRVLEVAPSGYYEWVFQPVSIGHRRTPDCFGLFVHRSPAHRTTDNADSSAAGWGLNCMRVGPALSQ